MSKLVINNKQIRINHQNNQQNPQQFIVFQQHNNMIKSLNLPITINNNIIDNNINRIVYNNINRIVYNNQMNRINVVNSNIIVKVQDEQNELPLKKRSHMRNFSQCNSINNSTNGNRMNNYITANSNYKLNAIIHQQNFNHSIDQQKSNTTILDDQIIKKVFNRQTLTIKNKISHNNNSNTFNTINNIQNINKNNNETNNENNKIDTNTNKLSINNMVNININSNQKLKQCSNRKQQKTIALKSVIFNSLKINNKQQNLNKQIRYNYEVNHNDIPQHIHQSWNKLLN